MANQTIVTFINNQRAKEISDSEIREELITKGWEKNDVNAAFREANSSSRKKKPDTDSTKETPTTSEAQSLKDLFEDKSGRDNTQEETTTESAEINKQQEELVKTFVGDIFTKSNQTSSDTYKLKGGELAYILPALPLFFFGGFVGAILSVGMIWRVTSILKDPESDKQEKKGKIILFYITTYSVGMLLFGIVAATGAYEFIKELLGISF